MLRQHQARKTVQEHHDKTHLYKAEPDTYTTASQCVEKGTTGRVLKRHKYSQLLFALLVTNRGPTPTLTCIIKSDDTRVTEAAVTFKLTIA